MDAVEKKMGHKENKEKAILDMALLLPVLAACVPRLCFYRNTAKGSWCGCAVV